MTNHKFIDKQEFIEKAHRFEDEYSVWASDHYQIKVDKFDKLTTFTELEIVKSYLEKLMIEVGNIEINRPIMSRGYECYGFEPKTAQEVKDEVMELIDNLLSESKGDTDET